MRGRWRVRKAGLILLALLAEISSGQTGATYNLERLVRQAGMIFAGRVVGVETGEKDKMNLYSTTYTFEVFDAIYGAPPDTVRIKQYGGEAEGRSYYPPGIPRFETGEEIVVMLYPPSKIGMTSTVGRSQGKFSVLGPDSTGTRHVLNGVDNRGLFRNLRNPGLLAEQSWADLQPNGPLPYESFVQSLRNLVAVLKNDKP